MAAIDVTDLHKHYGSNHAVDGVSFHVDQGEVSVLGVDPAKADRNFRNRIGIVLQSSGVETEFTVREVIDLYSSAYSNPRSLDEVIGLTGLDEKVDAQVGSLSESSVAPKCSFSTSRLQGSTHQRGVSRGTSSRP
jgi:ABC-2 type transport system ATP-binding protein